MNPASVLLAHIAIPPKLLVSLVVLGIALLVWAIVAIANSGKKPQQHVAPNAPPCNTCGLPARWNYNSWVCDRCQRAVVPMAYGQHGQPGMPPYGQPMPNMQPGQPPYGQPHMQPGQPPYGQPMPNMQQPGMAPQQMQQMGPTCQTCGGPGRWIPESNAWGCDRCRQLIAPPQQA